MLKAVASGSHKQFLGLGLHQSSKNPSFTKLKRDGSVTIHYSSELIYNVNYNKNVNVEEITARNNLNKD